MKIQKDEIKAVGLTLLYEPDGSKDPAVDIVLVHGLGGHPVRSWRCFDEGQTPTPITPTHPSSTRGKRLKKPPPTAHLRRTNSEPLLREEDGFVGRSRSLLRKASFKSSSRLRLAELPDQLNETLSTDVYWPLDFLPQSCPNARIFTWGYHTLVVDKKPLCLQGDIFAHASEFLLELATTRAALGTQARPLVFVAHSTGGVVVKEILRLADLERDGPLKDVLLSTSAVVFLGSPHRATEYSSLGGAVASMASEMLSVDIDDPVLSQLCGANSVELELGRQTFIRQWNEYNFRVQTFQESVIPAFADADEWSAATMRRLASFIGDPREKAATIGALHNSIAKFWSMEDAGYHALVAFLADAVRNEEDRRHVPDSKETDCLAALVRPPLSLADSYPTALYPGTCLWLYDLYDFQTWHNRSGPNKNNILWIRGESGCGKTVLLTSLRRRLRRQWGPACASIISVTADDHDRETAPGLSSANQRASLATVYRSLLGQLFLQDPDLRTALLALYDQSRADQGAFDDNQVVSFFSDYYINQAIKTPTRRTFILVEIPHEAGSLYVGELLGHLSRLAQNSEFSICVTSAHHPEIELKNMISIPMHVRNTDDILCFVNLNLMAEWEERNRTVMMVGRKAGGVFLWAEIVVNILNAAILEGATQELIEYTLEEVPGDLYGLYEWMLGTLNEKERAEALVLFQWVMLAAEPIRLNDLFIAVRLTDPNSSEMYQKSGPYMALDVGSPFSMRDLRQLRNSEITSDTPSQFHRWVRTRSIGLLEAKSDGNESLGLQRVQPIHCSVRSFFLSRRGFACLAPTMSCTPSSLTTTDLIDISHYTILRACLTYLNMRDFESLNQSPKSSPITKSPPFLKLETHLRPLSTVTTQRQLITSSYPFLQYAVSNLLLHLLSPTYFRYFLPQNELFLTLSANKFRLWKRWTSLLGTYDPEEIIALHTKTGSKTRGLMSPVYGARFRLERVLRKLGGLSAAAVKAKNEEKRDGKVRKKPGKFGRQGKGIMSPVTPILPASRLWKGDGREKVWKPVVSGQRFMLPEELVLDLPGGGEGWGQMSPIKLGTPGPLHVGLAV
ncbi:hypothetical protein QBC40DRAFT_219804 [Triangularia verruculosa]|uniref:Nephrocystin 3-like N-terminal domain-containing protein n=1 Tax=Triangularia verruculosa TaxID=2587418 RepID=A0AAN6XP58_9PEZI|nr:hypothetical protein QBC40DRAFT_219804 [Triangularia verruculosa]